MKLGVIVPAYNEEASLAEVLGSIPRVIRDVGVTVFVVDDGSDDATAAIAACSGAVVLSHRERRGLAAAFRTGLAAALADKADFIATIDADGQYRGEELSTLLGRLRAAKAELVVGDRRVWGMRHMPLGNRIGNVIGSAMLRLLARTGVNDASSGLRVFTARCGRSLRISSEHTYTHEMLIQARAYGFTVINETVTFLPRRHGRSKLVRTLRHHILRSCGTILRALFLFHPLRKFLLLSLVFCLFAALIVVWPLIHGGVWTGTSAILGGLMFVVALQFLVLGIIADSFASQRRLLTEEATLPARSS